jgi:sulfonate transport system permease protein
MVDISATKLIRKGGTGPSRRAAHTAQRPGFSGRAVTLRAAYPLAVFVIWELVCRAGLFPPEIVVPPEAIWATLQDMLHSGELQHNVVSSLSRLCLGYGLGAASGLALGLAMGLSPTVEAYLNPLFQFVRQLPTLILIPAFLMIFGVGETIIIVLVAKAAALPVALAGFEGVRGIPKVYFDLSGLYKVPLPTRLTQVILPALVPAVVTGMRLAFSHAWVVLVATELLVAQDGIGQMMEWGRQMFRIDYVIIGIILTALIGFGIDRCFRTAERRLGAWRYR